MNKKLKFLFLHSNITPFMIDWHNRINQARINQGFDVEILLLQPFPNRAEHFIFSELDRLWKRGDPTLLKFYEKIAEKLQNKDVLIHYNGAGLHPEFLSQLKVFKIYHCADDPESTDVLSKPVASYYDLQAVSNVNAIDLYKSWGLKNVFFWPLGSTFQLNELSDINEESIVNLKKRDIPIIFFGSKRGVDKRGFLNRIKNASYRSNTMELISSRFNNSYLAGSGWGKGYVSYKDMWSIYRRARIGWNVHNSTGPINIRTYDLPSFGVLQICDNKDGLSKIYDIGKEAVGFDTPEECIELTNYFLAHPEEACNIALDGWKRWKNDYHPEKIWNKLMEKIPIDCQDKYKMLDVYVIKTSLQNRVYNRRFLRYIFEPMEKLLKFSKRTIKLLLGKLNS